MMFSRTYCLFTKGYIFLWMFAKDLEQQQFTERNSWLTVLITTRLLCEFLKLDQKYVRYYLEKLNL